MAEKREKSLRQRFLDAQKKDDQKRRLMRSFPQTAGGVAKLYPQDHESLLRYSAVVKESILGLVDLMEKTSTTVNENWANRWRPDPVITVSLYAPATANAYNLTQLEGYKNIHKTCAEKEVDAQVSLKKVASPFNKAEERWVIMIDVSKRYRSSPDAGLFKALFKKAKKQNKTAGPAA